MVVDVKYLPRCKGGYNGLIPIFCKQCVGSRCNTDEVVLTVPPTDAQELLEVLCSIPMEVEMGEYSDGEPHRPPGVDSLIDQLIKYSLEDNTSIQNFEVLYTKDDCDKFNISNMPRSRLVKARYSWIVSKMEKIKYVLRQYY